MKFRDNFTILSNEQLIADIKVVFRFKHHPFIYPEISGYWNYKSPSLFKNFYYSKTENTCSEQSGFRGAIYVS